MPINAAFFNGKESQIDRVYAKGRREKVGEITDLYPHLVGLENFDEHVEKLQDLEVVFSTWGMPKLTEEHLAKLPNLKAVFYGAGSVQSFARPFLERGITVSSAWAANAVPVAEYCVAQIILSFKAYWQNIADCRDEEKRLSWQVKCKGPGMFGETVAFLGLGLITRKTIEFLKPYVMEKLVVSRHLGDDEAKALGLTKVSLEEAFERAFVISNHMANRPHTQGVIQGEHFERMRENATFINTGRGAQVDEAGMIEVLRKRPDITALLDVTDPEPPETGSPLYSLPNVHLTSHIAGSLGDEVVRMADYMIEEYQLYAAGKPLQHEVTLEMLETMA